MTMQQGQLLAKFLAAYITTFELVTSAKTWNWNQYGKTWTLENMTMYQAMEWEKQQQDAFNAMTEVLEDIGLDLPIDFEKYVPTIL